MMKTVRIYIDMFLCITVYTLWKFPDMLPVFTTYPPVFDKLLKGAGKCVRGWGGGGGGGGGGGHFKKWIAL